MNRFKKILWIIFILIILGGLGIFLRWKYMAKAKNMNALSLVPQDAMYILESTVKPSGSAFTETTPALKMLNFTIHTIGGFVDVTQIS